MMYFLQQGLTKYYRANADATSSNSARQVRSNFVAIIVYLLLSLISFKILELRGRKKRGSEGVRDGGKE